MNTDSETFTVPVTGKYKMGGDGIKLMNNNYRFLTRVFDKQEKRMLYIAKDYIGLGNDCFVTTKQDEIIIILFKDRYVPMQCVGYKDQNEKLMYESDIVIDKGHKAIITFDECRGDCLFLDPFNKEDCGYFHESIFETCTILGNKWENSKLWEKANGY